jgi:hypothetical protein
VLQAERARYRIWATDKVGTPAESADDGGAWLDEVPHSADIPSPKKKGLGVNSAKSVGEGIKGQSFKVGESKELYLGTEMFGPKVGPFIGNLNGMDTGITVDVWATRTLRRYFGTLPTNTTEKKSEDPDDDEDGDEGPTPQERAILTAMMRQVALLPQLRALGIKDGPDVQGVQWFFEQQLYNVLTGETESGFFSDGARDYVESKGHIVDEQGVEAATLDEAPTHKRRDHSEANRLADEAKHDPRLDEEVSRAVWADFQEDPESALKKPGWAILNGNLNGGNDAANAKSNDRLESELTRKGIDFQEVDGFWQGNPEGRSFLIFAPAKTALAIGKRYGQKAITTHKGFEYIDGKVDAADHSQTMVGDAAKTRDGYSVLPDGTAFSLGFPPEPSTEKTSASIAPEDQWNRPRDPSWDRPYDEAAGKRNAMAAGRVPGGKEVQPIRPAVQVGDGRGFTDFFTAASKGERAPDIKTYTPVLDISSVKSFSAEYVKHRGNFDDHIATSIPGFREVQQAVGAAIVKSYTAPGKTSSATLLDIAASEGAFNKAITAESDGAIFTLALDPNEQMAKFFEEHSQVPGADYDVAAFGSKADEGKVAWTEDSGTVIKTFRPIEQYDIVHESMGFQFIDGNRDAQFARVKELMRPNGIALFEEKVKENTPEWHANEAQKDAYKARYYTKTQMKEKAAEVLSKGGDSVVGMNDLMVTTPALEDALTKHWKHVVQYWSSGNFKGYVASDSLEAVDRFTGNLPDLNSEFSKVVTPHEVSKPDLETKVKRLLKVSQERKVRVVAVEAETGRSVEVEVPAGEAIESLNGDLDKARALLKCLSL